MAQGQTEDDSPTKSDMVDYLTVDNMKEEKIYDYMNEKQRTRLTVAMSKIISLFTTFTKASVNFESHWPARTDLLTGSLNFSLSTRTSVVVHCHPRG